MKTEKAAVRISVLGLIFMSLGGYENKELNDKLAKKVYNDLIEYTRGGKDAIVLRDDKLIGVPILDD